MSRRAFLNSIAGSGALSAPFIGRLGAVRRRTNILFAVSDDVGLQLGCYGEKLIYSLLAGRAKPPSAIDSDGALSAARAPRYNGTPVRAAWERFVDPPKFELSDLQTDPVEFTNLAGKPELKAVQQRLTTALLDWRKQTEDPFLQSEFLEQMFRDGAPALRNKPSDRRARQSHRRCA
jgi:hypothetical protein